MSTTDIDRPVGIKLRVLHAVRLIIASIGKFFLSLYYGAGGEKIPPIHDDILKEPAIVVARKIRDKEVSYSYNKLVIPRARTKSKHIGCPDAKALFIN